MEAHRFDDLQPLLVGQLPIDGDVLLGRVQIGRYPAQMRQIAIDERLLVGPPSIRRRRLLHRQGIAGVMG